ncbi:MULTISPECIES: universal stress protein [unclassified Roseateles]|uniref:universal stress protein n=1 Tax=unclassified Roseateles TaxID=2626991 RepID=UPI0006F215CD|nr:MULTISPECIES: universal stress protein [unclassified Roseateles]KQW42453.1 hypothetical protein ASC81_21635 [Pelomonas sp. Root405]KRA68327.1 hypothetical protein ASD88_23220 [Pelomonas sp. Root662]
MAAEFKHLLVATDGSLLADEAIKLALRVAPAAPMTALLVVHDYGLPEYLRAACGHPVDAKGLREAIVTEGRQRLSEAIARAGGDAGRIAQRVVLSDRSPSHEILATAEREGCDLIVMASHGMGGRLAGLLGSQSAAVLALTRLPVLVAR